MFMIKSAKFMKPESVLNALKQMFMTSSDTFSVSIHNDEGVYWLKPSDEPFTGTIKHNNHVNWKPYKGEPEQLA